jgi:hypothetical protein
MACFYAWQIRGERTLPLRYVLPAIFVLITAIAVVVGRFLVRIQGPVKLPPRN